jgi:hypothetical protein
MVNKNSQPLNQHCRKYIKRILHTEEKDKQNHKNMGKDKSHQMST